MADLPTCFPYLFSLLTDFLSSVVNCFVVRLALGCIAENRGGQERDGQFMVARDGVATASAIGDGAAHDVGQRAIGLNEVEMGGGEIP